MTVVSLQHHGPLTRTARMIRKCVPDLRPRFIQSPEQLEALHVAAGWRPAIPPGRSPSTRNPFLNPFQARLVGVGLCWVRPRRSGPTSPIAHQFGGRH